MGHLTSLQNSRRWYSLYPLIGMWRSGQGVPGLAREVAQHMLRGGEARMGGRADEVRAGHAISAGEDSSQRGGPGGRVDPDGALGGRHQKEVLVVEDRLHLVAEGQDDEVRLHAKRRVWNGRGRAAPGGIRSAERHADALNL